MSEPTRSTTVTWSGPAVIRRGPHHATAYVWDLFVPFLIGTGAGVLPWVFSLPHLAWTLPLFMLTKRAHVHIDHEHVTITWWWACVPFRRRRYPLTGGHFAPDWEATSTIGFVDANQCELDDDDAQFFCSGPRRVLALLEAARRDLGVPTARLRAR